MRLTGVRLVPAVLLCAASVLAGCTGDGSDDEATSPPKATASNSTSSEPGAGAIANGVPVAGTFVLRAERLQGPASVRVAIHAVRRVEGATVLDWSLTAVPTADHKPEDEVSLSPGDLGLSWRYGPTLELVDPGAGKVYRPLLGESLRNPACTCYEVGSASFELVVGETAMLQVAYPKLPPGLEVIDVSAMGTPTVEDVPVSPIGQVQAGGDTVDLGAAEEPKELGRSEPFNYPMGEGAVASYRLVAVVEEVRAGDHFTALVWRLEAERGGSDLRFNPSLPLTDEALAPSLVAYQNSTASGPGLVPDGADPATAPILRAGMATMRANTAKPDGKPADLDWLQCRCSDYLTRDKPLEDRGGQLQLVTETGPLPEGTTTVSVVFPGTDLPAIEGVEVTPAEPPAKPEFEKAEVDTYVVRPNERLDPPTIADWPTPLPSPESLVNTPKVFVDDLMLNTTEPNVRTEETPKKVAFTLDTAVFVAPDSAKLRPEAKRAIDRIAQRISDDAKPGAKVTVVGHYSGNRAGLLALPQRYSEERANAVRKSLQAGLGDADVRLVSSGRGAEEPIADNGERGDQLNQRVVVTFQR